MGPDPGSNGFVAAGGQDGIRLQQGHVAIDAILCNLLTHRFVFSACGYLVALQAATGIRSCIALDGMHIVAGGAGHGGGGEKATASFQQTHLVAVNVGPRGGIHGVGLQVAR